MMAMTCEAKARMVEISGQVEFVKDWRGCCEEPPEISVLIPCWHGEQTIAGALDSVEAQIGLPAAVGVEIVVVADGRPEDGWAVDAWIERLGDSRRSALTLVQLAGNVGAGAARRLGYRYCRGLLLTFLDDDDLWHPRKLAVQWHWHQKNPERLASAHGHGYQAAELDRSFARLLLGGCSLPTPVVMIRRSLWPYEPEPYRYGEDWLMLAMIARLQPIKVLAGNLSWRSTLALPLASDPYSLSRQRLRMRTSQLRSIRLLVERGCLHPIWMPLLGLWCLLLAFRRWLLDWVAGFREPVA
jgi:glycosyltransferase involved in cell wall biosynthesis